MFQHLLDNELDVTRITDRLLAIGMIWKRRSERKSCRNNLDDLAKLLNGKYSRRYLIWDLSGRSMFGCGHWCDRSYIHSLTWKMVSLVGTALLCSALPVPVFVPVLADSLHHFSHLCLS